VLSDYDAGGRALQHTVNQIANSDLTTEESKTAIG